MTGASSLSLSGERFTAVYDLACPGDQAEARAHDICLEQTVEFPEDLIPHQAIRDQIVGRVAWIEALGPNHFRAMIEFPVEAAGSELTQLINVLFGNISIKAGVRLVDFELPQSLLSVYRGPRFGQAGLRQWLGVPDRPLLCTAIKPMGLSPTELADLTYRLALGGIDLIKDDHGLADQPFCRFAPRVERCSDAVQRANAQTGLNCRYVPNVTGPSHQIPDRARLAKQAGAGGLLFIPGVAGLDTMRWLADEDDLSLPILAHPAFQGSFTVRPEEGVSHGVLYGRLNRLAGADAAIFPNYGGRFSFTQEQCRDLVDGCTRPMGALRPIFPVPAGGMSVERAPELCEFYGKQSILLVGGDLHRHGADLTENCRRLVRMVSEASSQCSESGVSVGQTTSK
jgi:ribulose-bisphosphate carboxylase large chain